MSSLGSIPAESSRITIYGLVGTIKLLSGYYLVVITGRSKVGVINGQEIWKAEKFETISYNRNDNHLNENEVIFRLVWFLYICNSFECYLYYLEKI